MQRELKRPTSQRSVQRGQVKKGKGLGGREGPAGEERDGRNNEGKIAVATQWWIAALVKLRACALAPSVRGTKRMNNNQLVRDARIQSQGGNGS